MFEKYDGVRGFWNPLKRAFYSRQGSQLRIPKDIVDSMPSDLFLDGEIWYYLCLSLSLCIDYLILVTLNQVWARQLSRSDEGCEEGR